MDNKKIYTIQINGIKESVNAVDSLNKQLDELEGRIKSLESRTVKVGTVGGSGGTSKTLSQQTSAEKEINKLKEEGIKLDAKIAAAQTEVYQNVLATKDVYKEVLADQKSIAAQERLTADAYSNTMQGMKQKLADLKSVINTTDLGDSDGIKKMTQEANELTNKLKEMEEAYGQFGRNVGNYKSATEGFDKIKVNIGGVIKEFDNLKQATKAIRDEMGTLEFNGKKDTEMYQQLEGELDKVTKAQLRLNSAMNDAKSSSKAMDDLLDTMESFGAMGQIGQGFSALFGFDNSEIEKSIQKLVALQNVMQGLEKIRQQLNTQEGIGKIFAKGSEQIDAMNFKLKRFIVSVNGTGTAAKVAAVGVNALSTAAKALASVGLVGLITAAFWAVEKIVGAISNWVKGDADLIDSTSALSAAIKKQNEDLEENLNLIKQKESAGQINAAQARIEQEKAYATALKEARDQFLKNEETYNKAGIVQRGKTSLFLSNAYGDKGATSWGGFDKGIESIKEFTERFDYLMVRVQNGQDITNSFVSTAEDAEDDLVHMTKLAGGDLYNAMVKFADGTTDGTKALVEYIRHMDELTEGRYSQAIKVGIDKGYLDGQFQYVWNQYETLKKSIYKSPLQVQLELDAELNTRLKGLDPNIALKEEISKYTKMLKDGVDEAGNVLTITQREQMSKIIEGDKKLMAQRNNKIISNYKKEQKTVQDAEKELNRLRIEAMKEGLNKTIKQLEEERRAKIAKIKLDGIMVEEMTLAVNKAIDKKIEEARKKHSENLVKINAEMWQKIYEQSWSNAQKEEELLKKQAEQERRSLDVGSSRYATDKGIGSYGVQGLKADKKNPLYPFIEGMQEYIDLSRELSTVEDRFKEQQIIWNELAKNESEYTKEYIDGQKFNVDYFENEYLKAWEKLDAKKQEILETFGVDEEAFEAFEQTLLSNSYSSSISKQFDQILANAELYWTQRIQLEKENAEKLYNQQTETADEWFKSESGKTWNNYQDELKLADDFYKQKLDLIEADEKSGKISEDEANKQRLEAYAEHYIATNNIYQNHAKEEEQLIKEHNQKVIDAENEKNDKLKVVNAEYFADILQKIRDEQTAISNLESKQPIKNAFGFTNWKETDKNNQKLLDAYIKQADVIKEKRTQLQSAYSAGLVDKDVYDATIREFDAFTDNYITKIQQLKEEMSLGNKIGTFLQEAQQYINAIGNGLTTILNAVWDAQDAAYDKMMRQLDETINGVKEKYDKMDALAEEHKNNMESIEDQIASAQGDAREHLLQRYNAEIEAQRAINREKKKAQKEEEKLNAKKEKMEEKQRKREHNRAVAQALINTALSVTYAAINHWPEPARTMVAMAAALGATQVAAIMAQKYAEGGVLQGKSHAQGGIKVLGGQAEVEGGEYITNKVTTAKNVDLLEYINTKKRRVNLDDLIEFYGGNSSVKKNIQGVRTKFADGGQIPMLSNNIELNNGLAQAMQEYANRPTVVSVVDILNGTEKVNNVKVLAGLA